MPLNTPPPSPDGWPPDDMMHRIRFAIWGLTGNNGLIGTAKQHEARLQALERWQSEIRTLRETARWIGLGVVAVLAWLLTVPAGTLAGRVLEALAK